MTIDAVPKVGNINTMRLDPQQKLKIVKSVINHEKSVTELSKEYKIARKTIYFWVNKYSKTSHRNKKTVLTTKYTKGKSHPRYSQCFLEDKIIRFIKKSPDCSIRNIAKSVNANTHIVFNILKGLKLTTQDSRIGFCKIYAFPGILAEDIKLSIVRSAENKEKKIHELANEYKVARKTIYKWIDQYRKSGNVKTEFVRGETHPKSFTESKVQSILSLVAKNPTLPIHKLAANLGISSHGLFNVLKRYSLTHSSERLIYAQTLISNAEQKQESFGIEGRVKSVFESFIPNMAPAPPPSRFSILKTFLFSFFGTTIIASGPLIWWSLVFSGASSASQIIGLVFATLALFMGSIFFLYSLKYYLSLGIVLSFSNKDEDKFIKKITLKSLVGQILGIKSEIELKENSAYGLDASMENVVLRGRPFVSVQIPFYNEKNVVRRAIEAAVNFKYPNYEIILADDSTDETSKIINDYQKSCLFKGEKLIETKGDGWTLSEVEVKPGVVLKHLHRISRDGYKGAALDLALKLVNPKTEYVSIFDADFVPYPDSLQLFLKYFQVSENSSMQNVAGSMENSSKIHTTDYLLHSTNSNVAAVQGYQWHVLNKSENWITRGVRSEYAGSYVIERSSAEIYGGLKQISGSVYMIKRDVLSKIGWGKSITEDFELTLKLYEKGYKVLYTPYIQAPSECVSTIKRLVKQRMRWAEGHSFNIKKMFMPLMTSKNLTIQEKLELIYLAPYYLQAFFFIVGTFSWLISETVFRVQIPFWTSVWGWSLVLTNTIALPLVNAVGLFIEESDNKDYSGLGSFVALSYLLVPFQAYAAIKGFIEKEEGPWFRTPKTGRITDLFARNKFYKFIEGILPGSTSNQSPSGISPYLSLSTANNRFDSFDIRKAKNRNWVGKVFLSVLLIITTNLITYMPYIEVIANSEITLPAAGKLIGFNGLVSSVKASDTIFEEGKLGMNFKLLNEKNTYTTAETPNLKIVDTRKTLTRITDYIKGVSFDENVKAKLVNAKGEEIKDTVSLEANDKVIEARVNNTKDLKSGNYSIEVTFGNEKLSQDFNWGVLAINSNKSIYTVNETAKLSMAVLDNLGTMVCDAKINLTITTPSGEVKLLSTENQLIKVNRDICLSKGFTLDSDYESNFIVGGVGKYSLKLEAFIKDGPRTIVDEFEVQEKPKFDVERISATRLYPGNIYPMIFIVKPQTDFAGLIEERVPVDFKVAEPKPGEIEKMLKLAEGEIPDSGAITPLEVKQKNDNQILQWVVNWKAGQEYLISYLYDSPDISPYFYNLGMFNIGTEFSENRKWQLAIDAVITNSPTANTGGWTNPTNAYADGTNYANITSGAPSASHTYGTYGISLTGSTINQVRVRYDAYSVGGATANQQRVPTSDESETGSWTTNPIWDDVDETSPNDADYGIGVTNGRQMFGYTPFSVPTGSTISNLTIYFRAQDASNGTNAIMPSLKVNGTYYDYATKSEPPNSPTWTTFNVVYATNPATGSAWTLDEINGVASATELQAFGVSSTDLNPDVRVSMVYAQANYTTANNEQISVDVSWDGGTSWSAKQTTDLTNAEATYWYDVTAATTWDATKLNDTNFKVRVEATTVGDTGDVRLDWIPVEVTHTPLTVSGVVYSVSGGAETICDASGATNELSLRANGTTYTTSCTDGTGAFSFSSDTPPSAGDGMVIWIEGLATDGATIIRYGGTGSSANNSLYESTVSVTSDDTTGVTILNMDVYDTVNDSDIPYTATDAATDTLSVNSNYNLRVNLKSGVANGSTVFDPNGTVTTQGTGKLHVATNAVAYLDTNSNTIADDVQVDDAGKINFDSNTTINGGDITVASGGDVASSTGTVTMGASGTIGGGSTGSVFQLTNLTVSSGTTTLGTDADDNLVFDGDISVSTGAGLAVNNKTIDLNGGNLTTVGTGVVSCSSCTSGGLTLSGDGTTNGIGGGGSVTLYNLTLDGATNTTNAGSSVVVMNDLNVGTGRTFAIGSNDITVGSTTISGSGDVTINGSTTQSPASTFTILSQSGSSISIFGTGVLGTGNLTVGDGSVDFFIDHYTDSLDLNIDGNFLLETNVEFDAGSGDFFVGGNFTKNGIFYNNVSTITFDASDSGNTITNTAFFNIVFNNALGSWSFLSTDIDVYSFTIISATNVVAPSGIMMVGNDFNGGPSFSHNNGTVMVDGDGGLTRYVNNSTTFYNFANNGTFELVFEAGETFRFVNNLTLYAVQDNCDSLQRLRSSVSGSPWYIDDDSGGITNVNFVDVKDSVATDQSITVANGINSGGNTGWSVTSACVVITSSAQASTSYSFQRKNFHDSVNSVAWMFFYDGDSIEAKYSNDSATTWNSPASANLAVNNYDFSLWYQPGDSYVYIAYILNNDLRVRKGTISSNDISWGTEYTALDGTGASSNYTYANIARGTRQGIYGLSQGGTMVPIII